MEPRPFPSTPRHATGPRRALGLTVAILATLTLYRLITLWALDLGLYGDEAYYFTWSLEPAFGYFSKPPVVAWLIAGTSAILGDTVLGVKAGSLLLYPATALLLFGVGSRLYGPRAGAAAAAMFATLPGVFLGSLVINTDVPLLFFWALSMWLLLRALDRDRAREWMAVGAAVGLGLLSKYTMILFPACAGLYLLVSPAHRHLWARPGPYLALALAGLLFLPNLVWNARHGFVSFAHTAEVSELAGPLFHPDHLATFLAGQFAVFGPVAMAIYLWLAGGGGQGYRREPERFLLTLSLPFLAAIAVQALLARAYLNWAAPTYLGAAVLVTGWTLTRNSRLFMAALGLNIALGLSLYHYQPVAHAVGVKEIPRSLDPRSRIRGWQELARAVEPVLERHPGAALLAEDRFVLAELRFYLRPGAFGYWSPGGRIRDHYALTADIRSRQGEDFLLVTGRRDPERLAPHFRDMERVGSVRIRRGAGRVEEYRFFLVRGFRGYAPSQSRTSPNSRVAPATAAGMAARLTTGMEVATRVAKPSPRARDRSAASTARCSRKLSPRAPRG